MIHNDDKFLFVDMNLCIFLAENHGYDSQIVIYISRLILTHHVIKFSNANLIFLILFLKLNRFHIFFSPNSQIFQLNNNDSFSIRFFTDDTELNA